ncbi:MAG: cation:proton antiporter [Luteolibacter sp.]
MSSLTYLTWILALGISCQWLAWRLKLPSILLLLAGGFAFGRISGVRIDDFLAASSDGSSVLLSVVGLFVAIILFEGGLTLKFRELRESGLPILRLCTLAVVISFGLTAVFMSQVLGYDWRIAALIGAILTVTGPTVIAPLLRHINPTRKMASMLKWEGIVVDPIGAILAVMVFKVAMATDMEAAQSETLQSLGIMIAVGVIGALVIAKLVEWLLRHHLVPDYLQPVFLLAVVAVAFTVSNAFEKEAGLLTVTVLGIALANQRHAFVRHILEFKENLRTLIISSLFIVLSGRIAPADLGGTLWKGLFLLIFLIAIGRPLSVYASLVFSKSTTFKEKTFLAAMAPRGIVAAAITSIFALEFEEAANHGQFGEKSVMIAGQSQELVALVFMVIVGTVATYGIAAVPMARRLGLASKNATGILFAGADPWIRRIAKTLHDNGHRVMLLDTNDKNISAAKMDGLEAHRANILSEFAEEELDFNGLGHLVAATPNDEVNSMAADRFSHQFTRAGVWQIEPIDRDEHHRKAAATDLRHNICFSQAPNQMELSELVAKPEITIKKTLITEVFSFDQFEQAYPDAIVLFLSDSKGLRPAPAKLGKILAGTTVYAMVNETPVIKS